MVSVFVRYALGGRTNRGEGGGRTHRASLQAGHDAKRGGNGGEDGDDDLQDLLPNRRLVLHGN